MNNKNILVASFVNKTNICWFLKYLEKKFSIKTDEVFVHEMDDNIVEYLVTFKMINDKKIDFKFNFDNATIVNSKNGCIFSINGLNKLIETNNKVETGNVNYNNFQIDWENYKGKLILSHKNKLCIKTLKKIDIKL